MKVIPAIDVLDGRVVRLEQGDFERVTDYGDDPGGIAERYADAGADTLHLVCLDGARDGTEQVAGLVAQVLARADVSIQAGGGVRDSRAVEAVLEAGATRVVVGSLAVREPATVESWLQAYGADAIVIALDVRIDAAGEPYPAVNGWLDTASESAWALLESYQDAGCRHLLCTDIACDGMASGPNVALYESIRMRHPGYDLQASGGVRSQADLDALAAVGVKSVIVGRAFLDGTLLR